MLSEARVCECVEPAPRAGVVLLTRQLRALLAEVEIAEAETSGTVRDEDAATAQLRARLDSLVEERRRTLEEGLLQAGGEAAACIAAATSAALAAAAESSRVAIQLWSPTGATTVGGSDHDRGQHRYRCSRPPPSLRCSTPIRRPVQPCRNLGSPEHPSRRRSRSGAPPSSLTCS